MLYYSKPKLKDKRLQKNRYCYFKYERGAILTNNLKKVEKSQEATNFILDTYLKYGEK